MLHKNGKFAVGTRLHEVLKCELHGQGRDSVTNCLKFK
jgi:hypothetical protein